MVDHLAGDPRYAALIRRDGSEEEC
jgi:hypothetical protein